jgi:hypothetical protein
MIFFHKWSVYAGIDKYTFYMDFKGVLNKLHTLSVCVRKQH